MMQRIDTESPRPLPIATHTFNRSADATIKKASEISSQRAGEYYDSWSLDNLMTPWLDNLLKAYPTPPKGLERHYKRLVIMASMIDIKLSRLGGPWKEDTAVDSINYIAAYAQLRSEFDREVSEPVKDFVRNGHKYTPYTGREHLSSTEADDALAATNLRA